jgi:hypothetical protein
MSVKSTNGAQVFDALVTNTMHGATDSRKSRFENAYGFAASALRNRRGQCAARTKLSIVLQNLGILRQTREPLIPRRAILLVVDRRTSTPLKGLMDELDAIAETPKNS